MLTNAQLLNRADQKGRRERDKKREEGKDTFCTQTIKIFKKQDNISPGVR